MAAVAEFQGSVPMGSPEPYLGQDPDRNHLERLWLNIAGKATDDPAYGNRLLFELAIDRAQLKAAVAQLDAVLRAYPSRGERHFQHTTLRAH